MRAAAVGYEMADKGKQLSWYPPAPACGSCFQPTKMKGGAVHSRKLLGRGMEEVPVRETSGEPTMMRASSSASCQRTNPLPHPQLLVGTTDTMQLRPFRLCIQLNPSGLHPAHPPLH